MKRFPVILFIIFGFLLISFLLFVVWLAAVVKAEGLRDFQSTAELEQFLDRGKQPILFIFRDGVPVDFSGGSGGICVPRAEGFIKGVEQAGYRVGRYRISSLDYYKFWYNVDPKWQPNEGHGVAWANVAGNLWLIEPTVPMAWELTVGYAGTKVGIAWE